MRAFEHSTLWGVFLVRGSRAPEEGRARVRLTNLPGFYPAVYPMTLVAAGLPLSDQTLLTSARRSLEAGTLDAHCANTDARRVPRISRAIGGP